MTNNTTQTTVNTTKTKVEIDHFSNARVRLLESYFNAKFNGGDTSKLTVELACMAQYGAVNSMVHRDNGKIASEVKFIKSKPVVSPEGKTKTVYIVDIKDLDINATSVMVKDSKKCKAGTVLPVFRTEEFGRAIKKVL